MMREPWHSAVRDVAFTLAAVNVVVTSGLLPVLKTQR